MSHNSETAIPSARRDLRELLVVALLLVVAALVHHAGHIPGSVNSATLIAAALSLWAGLRLVTVLRRLYRYLATPVAASSPHGPNNRRRRMPTQPGTARPDRTDGRRAPIGKAVSTDFPYLPDNQGEILPALENRTA